MKATIAILAGDGIGPEVTAEAVRVLEHVAALGDHRFELAPAAVGGAALAGTGSPLPEATLELCREADAVLLGAVGDPRWASAPPANRPEAGLLRLRKELGTFANLRPVRSLPTLAEASPLRAEVVADVDLLFVRELTGGIYFGKKGRDGDEAFDECRYAVHEIERIARVAFREAGNRRGKVTSVDKANVLETSRLWREIVERVAAEEFPGIDLEHQLVDAMAMHLCSRPADFDVVLTSNLFGDILTDEASMLTGALGLLPSASLGAESRGIYEPVHGSAPNLAGRGVANPFGAILSIALLLRHSLGLAGEAAAVEEAVDCALERGTRTADLSSPGEAAVPTREAGDAVLCALADAPYDYSPILPFNQSRSSSRS